VKRNKKKHVISSKRFAFTITHIKANLFDEMTSATLQNNCRLRIVLIIIISIVIRIGREFSSDSVHKATNLLEMNYILYGIILLLSLLPYKASWIFAVIVNAAAVVLGSLATVLAASSTIRCVGAKQIGCIQTLPGSAATLIAAGIIVALDIYQTWNFYLISRYPTFKTSASQRIRIIFSWALPFAWLLNIKAIIDDKWSWVIVTHLLADPLFIVLANSEEKLFLCVAGVITIVLDIFGLLFFDEPRIIMIQLALTAVGFIMMISTHSTHKNIKNKPIETTEPAESKFKGGLHYRSRKKSDNESQVNRLNF
tara:strand:+ start:306 stop:1238 length:933 start_codon:yes stop_codon:yes gene_type:complete